MKVPQKDYFEFPKPDLPRAKQQKLMPTVVELRELCRQKGLTGYSRLRKAELEALLAKLSLPPSLAETKQDELTQESKIPNLLESSSSVRFLKFYDPKAPCGEFSNFYPQKVVYNNLEYPTSEHAFQAAKFLYPGASPDSLAYAELIRREPNVNKIKILANQKRVGGYKWKTDLNPIIEKYQHVPLRPGWDLPSHQKGTARPLKVEIMREILLQKFGSNGKLKDFLLATDDWILIEDTPRDPFWGNGGKDYPIVGWLGLLLMEVREALQKQ